MYVCMCIYVCLCMSVCLYVYNYMYIMFLSFLTSKESFKDMEVIGQVCYQICYYDLIATPTLISSI